jgi:hypothetical protein
VAETPPCSECGAPSVGLVGVSITAIPYDGSPPATPTIPRETVNRRCARHMPEWLGPGYGPGKDEGPYRNVSGQWDAAKEALRLCVLALGRHGRPLAPEALAAAEKALKGMEDARDG